MWALRNLSTFCNTADEHHAVCLGFLLPWFGWYLIVRYGASSDSSRLLSSETWYVALGMTLRNLAFIGVGVFIVVVTLWLLGVI